MVVCTPALVLGLAAFRVDERSCMVHWLLLLPPLKAAAFAALEAVRDFDDGTADPTDLPLVDLPIVGWSRREERRERSVVEEQFTRDGRIFFSPQFIYRVEDRDDLIYYWSLKKTRKCPLAIGMRSHLLSVSIMAEAWYLGVISVMVLSCALGVTGVQARDVSGKDAVEEAAASARAGGVGGTRLQPLAPTRLLVEYTASPALGIDVAAPRFSWGVGVAASAASGASSGSRRVEQRAFRVQVCAVAVARSAPWDGSTWECNCGGSARSESPSLDATAQQRTGPGSSEGTCVWDSGRVNSSVHSNVAYGSTTPLRSDTAYSWRVMWWAARIDGSAPAVGVSATGRGVAPSSAASNFSSVARMDTGFIGGQGAGFPGAGSGAAWIGVTPAAFAASRLGTTQLRTEFALPGGAVVTRARAFVASPGYYTLRLNGADADTGAVQGAFTVFTRRVLYDVHDITQLLLGGGSGDGTQRHAVAITLGNGWYSQPTVNLGPRMVLVYIAVDYAHGRGNATQRGTTAVVSNAAWQAADGPTTLADIYLGATHDARLETPGWEQTGYPYSSAPTRWTPASVLPSPLLPSAGVLRAQIMPRIRQCQTFQPKAVRWYPKTATGPAAWVVDFGQNMAGTVQLTIPKAVLAATTAGSIITVRHAETVWPNGSLHHLYGGKVQERLTYIVGASRGSSSRATQTEHSSGVVFEPRHTSMGFRYIELSGSALDYGVDSMAGMAGLAGVAVGDAGRVAALPVGVEVGDLTQVCRVYPCLGKRTSLVLRRWYNILLAVHLPAPSRSGHQHSGIL